ncbi:MAG: tetratricopeptide repeat protein [Alphaproteobacteria bacterium]|nr:tetratricopeptide repeat protein [Alphaproteobacteria bacterium]
MSSDKQASFVKAEAAISAVSLDQSAVKSAIRTGVGTESNRARVHGSLGKLLLRQQRFVQAEQELSAAIALEPENSEWLLARSKSYLVTGKFDAALSDAADALVFNPKNAETNNQFGLVLLQKNRVDEAMLCFAEAIKCEPTNKWFYLHLAEAFRRKGQIDSSIDIVRLTLENTPDDPALYLNLLELYGEAQNSTMVIETLELARERKTATQQLCQRAAFIENALGELELAKRVISLGLELFPEDPILQHFNQAASNELPDRVSNDFIKDKYRNEAGDYDSQIVAKNLRTPGLLRAAILRMRPKLEPSRKVPHKLSAVLDLAAGTGITGIMVQDLTAMIKGIDLSFEMIAQAQKKHIYNEFEIEEISSVLANDRRLYEAILCLGGFRYYSQLESLFDLLYHRCLPNGFCVFDLEASPDPKRDFVMNPEGYFQHSRSYIETSLKAVGFEIIEIAEEVLYHSMGKPVQGFLISVVRPLG